MENYNGRNHEYNVSQGRATQISAHYNSATPTSSAGHFKKPQLPQQNTSKPRAQPLAHSSYLGDEHLLTSPHHEGYQYNGTTSPNYQNNYVTHQQTSSSSPTGVDFTYGYQQIPWTHSSHHYTSYNMPSMSFSPSYSVPHAVQTYPSSTASYQDLNPPVAGSMYEPGSLGSQAFHLSGLTALDSNDSYILHEKAKQDTTEQDDIVDLREMFDQYQLQTKEIFTLVRDRQLKPTGSLLLQISRFLIGNVEALGLDRDDKGQYKYRLELWDTFNHCWLTVLQSQYRTIQIMTRTGQQIPHGQSILDSDDLETLGHEIVKLCDSIDKTGLVDYQMGVAEERIVDILLKCLEVMGSKSPNRSRVSGSISSASAVRK